MFDPSVSALFPLPLTLFEKYMLLDDRPDHPMAFSIRLKFSGKLQQAVFESAFRESLALHPLLSATIAKKPARGRLVWTLDDRIVPKVEWDSPGVVRENARGGRIDLSVEPGLRIRVCQGEDSAVATLLIHHACCDAIGILGFLGHLLAVYALKCDASKSTTETSGGLSPFSSDEKGTVPLKSPSMQCPALPPCDPAGLKRRDFFANEIKQRAGFSRRIDAIGRGVRDGIRWLVRRPAILRPGVAGAGRASAPPCPDILTHVFDRIETGRLRRLAAGLDVTVNDLLLCDLFQALRQWIIRQQTTPADPWLRIAVPVNLKTKPDERLTAANGASYTFLSRHPRECMHSERLLRGIHAENDAATRQRRSRMFLKIFRLLERVPGATARYMSEHRCFSTAVLSNVGDIARHLGTTFPLESSRMRIGDVILDEVSGAPPVRPHTPASFMVGRYAERLWIGLRADPLVFTREQAEGLLNHYVEQIRRTIEEANNH